MPARQPPRPPRKGRLCPQLCPRRARRSGGSRPDARRAGAPSADQKSMADRRRVVCPRGDVALEPGALRRPARHNRRRLPSALCRGTRGACRDPQCNRPCLPMRGTVRTPGRLSTLLGRLCETIVVADAGVHGAHRTVPSFHRVSGDARARPARVDLSLSEACYCLDRHPHPPVAIIQVACPAYDFGAGGASPLPRTHPVFARRCSNRFSGLVPTYMWPEADSSSSPLGGRWEVAGRRVR